MTPADLLRYHTASPEMLAYLWLALENRSAMFVCGPSGSGKTTVWDVLSLFVPPHLRTERIEAREGEDLPARMRAALEQKPDYLLVQEVQGESARLAFEAMNEGHRLLTAVQFPDVPSMVHGLEDPPASVPRKHFPALDVLVLQNPVTVGGSKTRRMTRIVEFVGYEPEKNELITNWTHQWDPATDSFEWSEHSFVLEKLMEKGTPGPEIEEDLRRRSRVLTDMAAKGVTDREEAVRLLAAYPRAP